MLEDYEFIHIIDKQFSPVELGISFLDGEWLDFTPQEPLIINIEASGDEIPAHYIRNTVPLFSGTMIELFKAAGIDNFQAFPVKLISSIDGTVWDNYFAFNVLGTIDAIDHTASTGTIIMGGDMDGDGLPPLVDYTNIVINPEKANGALMFRDVKMPTQIIFDDKVIDFLKVGRPPEGWRVLVEFLDDMPG